MKFWKINKCYVYVPTICVRKSQWLSKLISNTAESVLRIVHIYIYIKVNCALVQARRLCTGRTAHRGSGGIALLFLDHGTRRGEESASSPGRSLPPGKTRYPLYRRLGGPQGRSAQVRKISPHRDSIPDRPARSGSLYRLSYRVHTHTHTHTHTHI